MHLELVELLRCPTLHAPSVLVAASDRTSARYVMEGVLGCPECGAEYAIREGVVRFSDAAAPLLESTHVLPADENSDSALRVAAQLGMTEGRSVYALIGFPVRTELAIRTLVPARLLMVNSRDQETFRDPSASFAAAPAGILQSADLQPLVPGKFDGVAFAESPGQTLLQQAVSLLKSGGRLVAPIAGTVPAGVTEMVRDERDWVATRDAIASAPVGITRR